MYVDVFGHKHRNYDDACHYKGHAGSGGIQNHSMGDAYPYMVEGYQIPGIERTLWRVLDGSSGRRFGYELSCRDAHVLAEKLKRQAPYMIVQMPSGLYYVARQDERGELSHAHISAKEAELTLHQLKLRDMMHG